MYPPSEMALDALVWLNRNVPSSPPRVVGEGTTPSPRPEWRWQSGNAGAGVYRYGFAEGDWIESDSKIPYFRPQEDLPPGSYTLYVQERHFWSGDWSASATAEAQVAAGVPGSSIGGLAAAIAGIAAAGSLGVRRWRTA